MRLLSVRERIDIQRILFRECPLFLCKKKKRRTIMIYATKTVRVVDGNIDGYRTVSQYANLKGLSCVSVRNWIRSGDIDAIKIGRTYYIPENTVPPEHKSRGMCGRMYCLNSSRCGNDQEKLNSTSRRIIECLKNNERMTVRGIWRYVSDRSLTAIYINLEDLVEKKLVTNKL